MADWLRRIGRLGVAETVLFATVLWKYGLIAPAVNGTHNFSSDRAYFRRLAEKEHIHPVTGERRKYCIGTFEG